MSWTYDAKAWRSSEGRGDKQLFTVSYQVNGSAGADEAHCLIDVSAGTAAEWPHKGVDEGTIKIYRIFIDIDIGAATGPILLGWIGENDGTDGTLQIIYEFSANDQRFDFDFSDAPLMCNSNFHVATTSGNYTVLQNDANYTASAGGTNHFPAVGDLVLLSDYDAANDFTRISVTVQYTVI